MRCAAIFGDTPPPFTGFPPISPLFARANRPAATSLRSPQAKSTRSDTLLQSGAACFAALEVRRAAPRSFAVALLDGVPGPSSRPVHSVGSSRIHTDERSSSPGCGMRRQGRDRYWLPIGSALASGSELTAAAGDAALADAARPTPRPRASRGSGPPSCPGCRQSHGRSFRPHLSRWPTAMEHAIDLPSYLRVGVDQNLGALAIPGPSHPFEIAFADDYDAHPVR